MRFGLVHRVMTDAFAALGVLAIVTTSSMSPLASGAILGGLALALAVPESAQNKPWLRQVATLGPLVLFVIQIARLMMGRSMLDIAIEFAATLQVLRVGTRRGAAHDQQIIVLALLHFVAGTVLGGGLAFGFCFVGFLIVAPGALVLSHLRREVEGNYRQGARDRTGLPVDVPRILRSRRVVGRGFLLSTSLLAIPIFAFTGILFLLFPRVGLSLLLLNHQKSGRMVGFSDKVDLGEVGTLRHDPTVALRFEVPNLPEPPPPRMTMRLRGTAFDTYNGRAWSRSIERRLEPPDLIDTLLVHRTPSPNDRKISIDLEPIDPPVIFLPGRTVAIRVHRPPQALLSEPIGLARGPEGEYRYTGADSRGIKYDVYIAGDKEPLPDVLTPNDRPRYLQVPEDLPRRFAGLAHQWADGQPTTYRKARAIEEMFRLSFEYDIASPSSGKPQPVDHFLFESKRGHCEFFSTSMAMMLRELNIPSRNVTGFVGGTYNRFGHYYAVREGDAHSWVEAYIDDVHAWVTFDPTPSAGAQPLQQTTGAWVYFRDLVEAMSQRWNRYVVGYDLKTQSHLLDTVTRRYDSYRHQRGVDRGTVGFFTRAPVIVLGLAVVGFVGYTYWKRRTKIAPEKPRAKSGPERDQELATILYKSMETALAMHGVTRPTGTPPLMHATTVRAHGHPLAAPVERITEMYLETRFGGRELSHQVQRDVEANLKIIRTHRPPTAAEQLAQAQAPSSQTSSAPE